MGAPKRLYLAEWQRSGTGFSWGFVKVDVGADDVAEDMEAYLRATDTDGELVKLSLYGTTGRVIWEKGMPAPGTKITTDMAGLTFEEAISASFGK